MKHDITQTHISCGLACLSALIPTYEGRRYTSYNIIHYRRIGFTIILSCHILPCFNV